MCVDRLTTIKYHSSSPHIRGRPDGGRRADESGLQAKLMCLLCKKKIIEIWFPCWLWKEKMSAEGWRIKDGRSCRRYMTAWEIQPNEWGWISSVKRKIQRIQKINRNAKGRDRNETRRKKVGNKALECREGETHQGGKINWDVWRGTSRVAPSSSSFSVVCQVMVIPVSQGLRLCKGCRCMFGRGNQKAAFKKLVSF